MRMLAMAAVALLAMPSHAVVSPRPAGPDAIGFDYAHTVLAPGVHLLAQSEQFRVQPLGNVTLIEQDDGFVLVDAGGTPASGRRIVETVRALADKPVKAVVLTHWHGDHVLGAAEILRAWPQARLIATRVTRDAMMEGLKPYADPTTLVVALDRVQAAYRTQAARIALAAVERDGFSRAAAEVAAYAAQFDGAGMVLPTEFVDDQIEIPDASLPVIVRHVGVGNTAGDLVFWLPSERILITGDLAVRPVPFAFDVRPRAWAEVLHTLAGWEAQTIVPGHGAPMADDRYLLQLADWLCDAHARAVAAAVPGVPPGRIELSDQIDAIAGADPWLRRWAAEYWGAPLAVSARRDVEESGAPLGCARLHAPDAGE